MKANASKFQLMYLTRGNITEENDIMLGEAKIKASKTINILGVELDDKLKLNYQIDEVCSQAGKQINALKRIKQYLEKDCEMTIYSSYINSCFNYCSAVWMHTNKTNLEKLEKTNKEHLDLLLIRDI